MALPPIPNAAIAARPSLAEDLDAQHPANGMRLPPPPRRYTRGLHDQIVAKVRQGNRPAVAAAMCGLPTSAFYAWMKSGREGDPHLEAFAEDVERAEAEAEGEAVEVVRSNFADNPDNAKWWLERSRPRGWNKSAVSLAEAQIAEFMSRLEASLPAEIWAMVLAAGTGQTATLPEPKPLLILTQSNDADQEDS